MKDFRKYEEIKKYSQDKLKVKLILVYLMLSFTMGLSILMVYYSFNAGLNYVDSSYSYVPKKIENKVIENNNLDSKQENVNIVNYGTATININNYYENEKNIEDKKNIGFEDNIFDINLKTDLYIREDNTNYTIIDIKKYKDKTNCFALAEVELDKNTRRTFFGLTDLICEDSVEKISGFVIGEDAKMGVLTFSENNEISKLMAINLMKSYVSVLSDNSKINTEIFKNLENELFNKVENVYDNSSKIYKISKERKLSAFILKKNNLEKIDNQTMKMNETSEYSEIYRKKLIDNMNKLNENKLTQWCSDKTNDISICSKK